MLDPGDSRRRSVAALHDLVVRADGHSLGEIAVRVRNRSFVSTNMVLPLITAIAPPGPAPSTGTF